MFSCKVRRVLPQRYCLMLMCCALFGCDATRTTQIEQPVKPLPGRLNFEWNQLEEGLRAARLPDRLPRDQAKRFTALPVSATGLDFAHDWEPGPDYQLKIYNSLPGGGICLGDCDGDLLPDVYLTQPNVGSRLYRNLGSFRFEDITEQAGLGGLSQAQGATFVDIDNDGDLDLFVCNSEQPNALFINDGAGHFENQASEAGLDFQGASVMAAFADYDRDGDLDLYLVTNRVEPVKPPAAPQVRADGSYFIPEADREFVDVIVDSDGGRRIVKAAQYDHLYRNEGDGTFTDVSQDAGLIGPYWGLSANWWDFNQDGHLDLYVSNDFYSPDQLYQNNGDGTFTDVAPKALPHTPWYSMGSDVADINNDGWFDLMGSDMSGTSHYKQKASMGDMSTTSWFLTHPTPRQYMRNALYLNTGTDRFMEIAQLAGVANTDWTWSLKFADLDEDGWVDLFVTNGMNRDWTNSDLRHLSNQAKTEADKIQVWLESPQRRDPNLAFRNLGDLRFEDMKGRWGLGDEQVSYGAALGDLDGDGDLDMIVNNAEEAPSVYRNQTSDSHRITLRLEGEANNRVGLGATVGIKTADGMQWRQLSNCQGFMSSNQPLVHFGVGQCDRVEHLQVIWPNGHRQIYRDLPADQYYVVRETSTEVVEAEPPDSKPQAFFQAVPLLAQIRHEETPFNDYARQPLLPNQLSQLGPGMAWGDVDADGDVDLFIAGASGQSGRLLINDGQGGFVEQSSLAWEKEASAEDMAPLFFDSDGDSDLDLYVVSGGVECEPGDEILQDRLYLNDGQGGFERSPRESLPAMRTSGSVVAAADFDRDGDLDLFVGGRVVPGKYPLSPRSYLLQNDAGQFRDVTADLAPSLVRPGLVTSAVWSDSDGDQWVDLIVTTEWGAVARFGNQQGRLEKSKRAFQGRTGWFNSVIPHDFDNDGDLDYAVGNQGWNTKYHASAEQPALLYYGDFEQSGQFHLVEAEFEDETLFPVRGKSCSTNAMPFLGDKFTRFHDFAIASLDEIYTDSKLTSAHRYEATLLSSGVWLNQGDDNFEFVPLPVMAQVAPIFGLAVCDANGDAFADLVVGQNFFGPQAETGRADGGVSLLLIGQGDGRFVPLPAHQSGIVVPGDATSLCRVDMDGDACPELCIATNDGPVYVFHRIAPQQQKWTTVRLIGSAGNPRAIGAQVIAHFSQGPSVTRELSAGGGYLSQSAPTLFFTSNSQRRLQQIVVRWPDGTTTTTPLTDSDRSIKIRQDQSLQTTLGAASE
ncbi:MAG: RNA-binding protein [Planctomycetaceae bacterium]|nr:RNA-binding protein [Planctomycetaceae bacterium]